MIFSDKDVAKWEIECWSRYRNESSLAGLRFILPRIIKNQHGLHHDEHVQLAKQELSALPKVD